MGSYFEDQEYNLRWHKHSSNFVQGCCNLFESQQLTDVTLSCQGKFIGAHKIVLAAGSPYFQEIFLRHSSADHPMIIMSGVKFCDLQAILEFMYTGQVTVMASGLRSVVSTAKNLQVEGLSEVRSASSSPCRQQSAQPSMPLSKGSTRFCSSSPNVKTKKSDNGSYESSQIIAQSSALNPNVAAGSPSNSQCSTSSNPGILNSKRKRIRKSTKESPDKCDDGMKLKKETAENPKKMKPAIQPLKSFVGFAHELRSEVAAKFPNESNNEISIRLGAMWKALLDDEKAINAEYLQKDVKERCLGLQDANYKCSPGEAHNIIKSRREVQAKQIGCNNSVDAYNPLDLLELSIEVDELDEGEYSDSNSNTASQSNNLPSAQEPDGS